MHHRVAILLIFSCLAITGCADPTSNKNVGGGQGVQDNKSLEGVSKLARSFGYRIPVNEELVRLMRLQTSSDGKFYAWQFGTSPAENDVRAVDVADKNSVDIILTRVDTRPNAFERYSHLTNLRGEFRGTVYSSSGSREQRVIASGDRDYQKALKDFEGQVMFWTSRELQIRSKFPEGAPRQTWGEPLDLR